MEDRDRYTFRAVEHIMCSFVNDIEVDKASSVSPEKFYIQKKNIPSLLAAARNLTLYILHSKYGYPYSILAEYSKMTKESVMRCVRKCRQRIEVDGIYSRAISYIEDRLKEKYGKQFV